MPNETPILGLPFPLPEDALVDYPATGQELAETIEHLITELAFSQITATFTVGSLQPAFDTVIPGSAVAYDGTPVLAEFVSPAVSPPMTASGYITLGLFDELGTRQGYCQVFYPGGGGSFGVPLAWRFPFTPPAAVKTYSIGAFVSSGNGYVNAGLPGQYGPAYLRITRALAGAPRLALKPGPPEGNPPIELPPYLAELH